MPFAADPEHVHEALCAPRPYSFWLDSSRVMPGVSRFSFLGFPGGRHGEVLRYRVGSPAVEVLDATGQPRGELPGDIFGALRDRLTERAVPTDELPFDLDGGYVGYFGYELKADCGSPNTRVSPAPDAVWIAATRLVAIDHELGETWLVALCRDGEDDAERWIADAREELAGQASPVVPDRGDELDFSDLLRVPRDRYLDDVEACLEQLRAGESYEICLTNEVDLDFTGDPRALYRRQRRHNPAPYAAYLALGDVQVLCSSPERFLRVGRDGVCESRPIKGTAPRRGDPAIDDVVRKELASSDKTRAENLMIVDLLRNDFGRVCRMGSVHVPSFLAVESYATVHQLVSTVRGRLPEGTDAVELTRACFPGGSMTGAPKLRTMEIIDELEDRPRGVYSGALGYFGLGGAADLNIVIRTAVAQRGRLSAGAGGAIVLDSDPVEEHEEMLLKLHAPLRGLTRRDVGGPTGSGFSRPPAR
ncbi:aminodeoxychorismate synthase component I [Saccharopolyspora griseoalba]|uniref:aminodeoxychorismate synthase n=1 Tax=Saccharopolyspora griseoalba TaxID=1431848 RepID=A0ABW2LFU6_9PSEU